MSPGSNPIAVETMPHLAAATPEEAIKLVNRWLHREVGFSLSTTSAVFNPSTFCWHLPVHLSYGSTGPLGVIGDIFLNAATGEFLGAPEVGELRHRAESLAERCGISE